jgi:hypothetical protein
MWFLAIPVLVFAYLFGLPQIQAYREWTGKAWFTNTNDTVQIWVPDSSPDMVNEHAWLREAMEKKGWRFEDYRPKKQSLRVVK